MSDSRRTPLSLEDALTDVGALRQVGEGVIRLALATEQHVPDSRVPMHLYTAPWPTEDERVAAVGPEPDPNDPFLAGEHQAWVANVAAARSWQPPEGEDHNIIAEYDPLFRQFTLGMTDAEPHLARRRAALARTTTAHLRERYWEATQAMHDARTSSTAREAAGEPYAVIAGDADTHEDERRIIMDELNRRGAALTGGD